MNIADWLQGLCPEIAEWQANLIQIEIERIVKEERERCAQLCDTHAQNACDDEGYRHLKWLARDIRGAV